MLVVTHPRVAPGWTLRSYAASTRRVPSCELARGVSASVVSRCRAAIGMKVALALASVVALTVPLDQREGEGMAFRFPLYMLSTVVMPLAWRRRSRPLSSTSYVLAWTGISVGWSAHHCLRRASARRMWFSYH